ncbi:LicD family protein [Marinospirillum insulare]|uniref:LicD/FKTN/FKRP nucleotidyltransferase domain-containing protein n=1 Tax=Marinospirillum insulare TaxID=217169 RepID=A0ABQ5ZW59_9GAMM|nr:LicD family protein [Marinospirillum insulare]GLR64420.1 hypothetical protein GCM10007878_18580 [Marinospirillum insulare]
MYHSKKVILFGASKGGDSFITHNQHLKVLAIADNDTQRWGSQLLGIPIINPTEIPTYIFDEIIITSQWQDSIISQLVNQLGITRDKITTPSKSNLKPSEAPFSHPATLAIAQQSLGIISEFLNKNGITAILDSGSALGVVRDGDLIAWDDDIDLAVNAPDFDKLILLTSKLLKELPQHPAGKWQATVVTLANEDVCVNIDLISNNKDELKGIEISLQKRTEHQDRSELVSSAGMFDAPAIHFQNPQAVDFYGYKVYLPNQAEEFLTFMYGDWKNPRPETKIQDYDNRHQQQQADPRSYQISKRSIA